MRLTVDTNCINTKQAMPAMNTIERWEHERRVTLFRTQRSLMEVRNHPPARAKVLDRPNVGEPAIADVSFLDSDAYYDDAPGAAFDAMFKLLFRNLDLTDVMHILSHQSSGNDIFVTTDNDFLREAARLKAQWDITIMSPDETVSHCQRVHGWT